VHEAIFGFSLMVRNIRPRLGELRRSETNNSL
jgi:hypothetical protein